VNYSNGYFALIAALAFGPLAALGQDNRPEIIEDPKPTDFQYRADLGRPQEIGAPVRVHLPAKVFSETLNGFADLRLYDDTGQETPFVIYEEKRLGEGPRRFPFKVLSYEEGEDSRSIVLERPEKEPDYDSIEIVTPARDFQKSIRLEASEDRESWRPIGEDTIFDFSSKVNLRKVHMDHPPLAARYLKVTINEEEGWKEEGTDVSLRYKDLDFSVRETRGETFRVDSVMGHKSERSAHEIVDRTDWTGYETSRDEEGATILELGRVNLPLTEISFDIADDYYYREVEVWASDTGSGEDYRRQTSASVYRIVGMAVPDATLELNGLQAKYLQLRILNQDNPPLEIQGVHFTWNRRNLYFLPQEGRDYALYFGNERVRAPQYETARLIPNKPEVLVAYPSVEPKEVVPNATYSQRRDAAEIQSWILYAVVLLLLVGLTAWGVKIVTQASNPSEGTPQ
jgi:hypothetical protein